MAGRPKYTPKPIYKKRRGYNRKRTVLSLPEDYDLAIRLHSAFIAKELGKRSVSPSDAILDVLSRSRTVQDHLPKARAIIKAKQEHESESEGGQTTTTSE